MSVNRDDVTRRLEEFNKRAEEMRQASAPMPATPPATPVPAQLVDMPNDALSAGQRIEKQAQITTSDLNREQHEREAAERRRQLEEGNTIDKVQEAGRQTVAGALDVAQPPIRWLESIPTWGGLGLILGVIVLFLMAVVPVDQAGNTRLKLIWYTLSGKTHLRPGSSSSSGTSSSGNSNTTTLPITSTGTTPTPRPGNVPIDLSNMPDMSGLDLFNL